MGADRADLPADRPASGQGAEVRPAVVRHPGGGEPADGVALSSDRALRVLPQGRRAAMAARGHLQRHAAVHGAAADRPAGADDGAAARAVAAGRALYEIAAVEYLKRAAKTPDTDTAEARRVVEEM